MTTMNSLDNFIHIVGNNKVFSKTIINFSTNDARRVELVAQLNHSVDYKDAIERLRACQQDRQHIDEPRGAGARGSFLHQQDHYSQVFFDTNAALEAEFGAAGDSVPEQYFHVQTKAA